MTSTHKSLIFFNLADEGRSYPEITADDWKTGAAVCMFDLTLAASGGLYRMYTQQKLSVSPASPFIGPRMGRIALAVLALLLCAVGANADTFQIQFTGDLTGTGSFTTDGVCAQCQQGFGLLSFLVDLGTDTGADQFDLAMDANNLDWDPSLGTFLVIHPELDNIETGDKIVLSSNPPPPPASVWDWHLISSSGETFTGLYTITEVSGVPEPGPMILLVTMMTILAVLSRRRLRAPGRGRS
jgi:hypothetical protein